VVQGLLEGTVDKALGTLTPAFVATGRKPGIYERDGASGWTHEGKPLPKVATILTTAQVVIKSIDGESPEKYRSGEYYFIPPGMHTLELFYDDGGIKRGLKTGDRTYSKGSVTFNMRYFFEDTQYVCTGVVVGEKIIFRIERD
jgi:hypothetical protein